MPGRSSATRAAGQGEGAIDADLGGGDVAGIELEADNAGLGGTLLLAEHGRCIGISAAALERTLLEVLTVV